MIEYFHDILGNKILLTGTVKVAVTDETTF